VWWLWIVGGLVAWVVVAFAVAMVVGKSIRLADQRTVPVLTPVPAATDRSEVPAPARRRGVPLPPLGVALAAGAVALETVGYLTRLNGGTGQAARLLSMDAPFSLPRLYVALLFAAAAFAAVAGAGSIPGRRTWWTAVGVVAGAIAAVKAGSTVHADAVTALGAALGAWGATLVSIGAAGAVVGVLWFLSRTERRDRRRILGVLALYAVASVGLSAVSSLIATASSRASSWVATATFLEESAEALAGVAFLVAVLVGVAPRLVLPAAWALRREADAHTLELPEGLPGRPAEGTARS
jgi:hypothetical protein